MNKEPTSAHKSHPVKAAFLRELRKRCGWTQEDLAEQTGLSDRSIRNAEAGKPIHLRSISILCNVLNRALMLSLSPVHILESPPSGLRAVEDPAKLLITLALGMFDENSNLRLEDFVAEQVVYYCELGVLVGLPEVQRRISALATSSGMFVPIIRCLSASGQYATASWELSHRNPSTTNLGNSGRHGCICVRVKDGCIVEAWDFPVCREHLCETPSIPKRTGLGRSTKVNSELIRAKRLAEAITQEDLATRTGLSLRLIRSAENGKSISIRSCEAIAKSLSLPLNTIQTARVDPAYQTFMGRRAKEYLEEIWNHENYNVINTHLTNKFRFHHEMGVVSDREQMRMRIEQFRKSFGEFDFTVTSTLDFGSFVICKWQVMMTHIGTWLDIDPTGIRVTVNGASWVHIVGEQFGDAWDFWNPALVLSRLKQA